MGAEAGRRRRSQVARHLAAGHAGSVEKDAQSRPEPIEALSPAHRPVMDATEGGAGSDDFVGLLKRMGHIGPIGPIGPTAATVDIPQTHATTILAFKFQGGV